MSARTVLFATLIACVLVFGCGAAVPTTDSAEREVVRLSLAAGNIARIEGILDENRYPEQRMALVDGLVAIVKKRGTARECERVLSKYAESIAAPKALRERCDEIEEEARRTIDRHIDTLFRGETPKLPGEGAYLDRALALWDVPPLAETLRELRFVVGLGINEPAARESSPSSNRPVVIVSVLGSTASMRRASARDWAVRETEAALREREESECPKFGEAAESILHAATPAPGDAVGVELLERIRPIVWKEIERRAGRATCDQATCLAGFAMRSGLGAWSADRKDIDASLVSLVSATSSWPVKALVHHIGSVRGFTAAGTKLSPDALLAALKDASQSACLLPMLDVERGTSRFRSEVDDLLVTRVKATRNFKELAAWRKSFPSYIRFTAARSAEATRFSEIAANAEKIVLAKARLSSSMSVKTEAKTEEVCVDSRSSVSGSRCSRCSVRSYNGTIYESSSCSGYDVITCLEYEKVESSECVRRANKTYYRHPGTARVAVSVPNLDLGPVTIAIAVNMDTEWAFQEDGVLYDTAKHRAFRLTLPGDKAKTDTDEQDFRGYWDQYPKITSTSISSVSFSLVEASK